MPLAARFPQVWNGAKSIVSLIFLNVLKSKHAACAKTAQIGEAVISPHAASNPWANLQMTFSQLE